MISQDLHDFTPMQRLNMATTVELPYSEVCMHMRIAGQTKPVVKLDYGMAQILNEDGTMFTGAVTRGEAGVSYDG